MGGLVEQIDQINQIISGLNKRYPRKVRNNTLYYVRIM
jgi:hypothetical protein